MLFTHRIEGKAMMRKRIFWTLVVLFISASCSASGADVEWIRYYGGPYGLINSSALELPSGMLVIVGATDFAPPHLGLDADVAVVLLGQDGTQLWELSLGGDSWDRPVDISLTPDGSILIVGRRGTPFATEDAAPEISIYAAKIHPFGILLWEGEFGDYEELQQAHPEDCPYWSGDPEGWWWIGGARPTDWDQTARPIYMKWNQEQSQTWIQPRSLEIAEVLSNGDLVNHVTVTDSVLNAKIGFKALVNGEGGYTLVGTIREHDRYDNYESLVVEIVDLAGNITSRSYLSVRRDPEFEHYECFVGGRGLSRTEDGGLLILLHDSDPDGVSLLKTTASGATEWEITFAGVDESFGVLATSNSGAIVLAMDYDRTCATDNRSCPSSEWFISRVSGDW